MKIFNPQEPLDFSKANGLIPVIAQDATSLEVLMLAYMNEEAWQKTLLTGEAYYFSRSRNELWHKGATSGHIQKIQRIFIDCDRDTIVLHIEQIGGAACHTGYRSCFHKEVTDTEERICCPLVFNPKEIYNS